MGFIFSAISAVGHPGAKVGPWGTNHTLCSAPSAEQGDKRHIRGCLRGGPAGVRLGAPPLSAWLIRRTSSTESKAILAGVLGASGRSSVVLSMSSILPTPQGWQALVWLSAESGAVLGRLQAIGSKCSIT